MNQIPQRPENSNQSLQDEHPLFKSIKALFSAHTWMGRVLLAPEFYSFLVFVVSLVWLAEHYFVLFNQDPRRANHLWKIMCYHFSGGAVFGVLKGAGYEDMTLFDNILCNLLITTCVILLFNTLFSLSCKKIYKIAFLENSFSDLKNNAKGQRKIWNRFGIPGVFAFVFFPMTGTGPIIGSVIAKVIGLGFWTSILTVLAGSYTSILMSSLAADKISDLVGDKTLSRIVFGLILILLLTAGVTKLRSWRKQRRENPSHTNQD